MTSQLCAHCANPLPEGSQFCPQCGASRGGSRPDVPDGTTGLWEAILDRLRKAAAPRYEVLSLLGYGGMAGVYLAEEPRLERQVAIKVMSPSLMLDPKQVERFKQEARSTARLSHPNIVTIHEIDERGGLQYFVMSYVPGQTVRQVLDEAEGPLPIARTLRWIRQIAGALHHAHRLGIVHRDIKPGNVLLDADQNALVTDFGIAKVSDEPGLTKTGMMVGTPTYMSPEQCLSEDVTGATDQYALGILAYQLLTGQPPFTGATMAVLHAHVSREPDPILARRPDCPPWLAALVERMLAKNPADRWPSLADVLAAVEEETSSASISKVTMKLPAAGGAGTATGAGEPVGPDPVPADTGERRAGGAGSSAAGLSGAGDPGDEALPIWRNPKLVGAAVVVVLLGGVLAWGPWRSGSEEGTLAPPSAAADAPATTAEDPADPAGTPPTTPATDPPGDPDPPATDDPPPVATPPTQTQQAPPPTTPPPPPAPAVLRVGGTLPSGATVRATGPTGSVELSAGATQLRAGTWVLSFEAEGFQSDRSEVTLDPGQDFEWTPTVERVAPPVAVPPPTEPPPPAFDEEAVRALVTAEVAAFVGAFESRDLAEVLQRFPNATREWQDEWRILITDTRNIRELSTRVADLTHVSTSESRAEVRFQMGFDFVDFRNQRQNQSHLFRAVLVPAEGQWRILQLESVR